MKRTSLASLKGILWSRRPSSLDLKTDKNYIIHQVLAYGNPEELKFLFKLYSKKEVIQVFKNSPKKTYTIGRRGEYRDYVDLYFLLKNGLALKTISQEAQKRFEGAFSPRLFLEQLVYFKDLPSQILAFFQKEIKT